MTTPSDYVAKLKAKIKDKTDLKKILNQHVLNEIGATIVDEMKSEIASGNSPIDGHGAFPAYKRPEKYPGKRKPARPVNLELTGQMLNSLQYRINQAKIAITILYRTKKAQLKELGHREGANDQPKRPTIPDGNEQLSKAITKKVQMIIDKTLRTASLTWKS